MLKDALFTLMEHQKNALASNAGENDYVKDGLLHCGICGTPKQCRIAVPESARELIGTDEIFPHVMCKCQRDAQEAEAAEERARVIAENIRRIRSAGLMDARLYDADFDKCIIDASNTKALRISKKYAESFERMEAENQGMLFYGPPGTGKTFAAACIANALIARNVFVIMTSFVKLLRIAYKGGAEWIRTTENLTGARLLIIDDLGAERDTDTALEHVYGIVDDRYRAKKPVIFTTNLGLSDLKNPGNIRAARIYDRVLETCYPVAFAGVSWRQHEAANRFEAMKALMDGFDAIDG